jgi:hypothetical protein
MLEIQTDLINYGAKDQLQFGNCKYRFIDPSRAPTLQPKGAGFEGVICSHMQILCDGYWDECMCGCWEPRDPRKGFYTWSTAENADPYKGSYGPVPRTF